MHSVRKIPDGLELPDLNQLISGRPPTAFGDSFDWINLNEPVPVFIERLEICIESVRRLIMLFGARYENSEIRVNGQKRHAGHGNFIEYFVIEKIHTGWKAHRLLHHKSVTMTDLDEENDFISADKINASEFSLDNVPSWVKSEAQWPTLRGAPMVFVGQVTLPETEVTRTFLTWDKKIFLFWLPEGDNSRFKIFAQNVKFQSSEDHYREEEGRERRRKK